MNRKPKAILEGLLFANGEAISVKTLSEVMNLDESEVLKLIWSLKDEYDNDENRGIHIIQLEDSYQLCTKREFYDYIHLLRESNRRASLTNAGLEVLSVVAYNQPVTRNTIEFIRGVNSDGPLNNLVAAGLVKEVGRLAAPGRPILFGTTEEFLRCFNIPSLEDLPKVDDELNLDGIKGQFGGAPILSDEYSSEQMDILSESAEDTQSSEISTDFETLQQDDENSDIR